ncbi:unnamed protein product, partial [Symbiodinium pilosum]
PSQEEPTLRHGQPTSGGRGDLVKLRGRSSAGPQHSLPCTQPESSRTASLAASQSSGCPAQARAPNAASALPDGPVARGGDLGREDELAPFPGTVGGVEGPPDQAGPGPQHEEGRGSSGLVHWGRRPVVEVAGLGPGQQISPDGRDPGHNPSRPPSGCAADHNVGDGAPGAHPELQIHSSPHRRDASAQQHSVSPDHRPQDRGRLVAQTVEGHEWTG